MRPGKGAGDPAIWLGARRIWESGKLEEEHPAVNWTKVKYVLRFSELVQTLEKNGFRLLKEKGSVRYYRKPEHDRLIRVDYHGSKEVPNGTCHAILKAAGIKPGGNDD